MVKKSMTFSYKSNRFVSGDMLRSLAEEALSNAPGVSNFEIEKCVSNRVQVLINYEYRDVAILLDDWLRQFDFFLVDLSDHADSSTSLS